MHALPAAPPPAPRRQLMVGTSLACAAGATLMGGMFALYLRFREATLAVPESEWKPAASKVPEVATNIMLISFAVIFVMVQWSVYAARRGHKSYVALSLGLTALFSVAIINGQVFTYTQMRLPIRTGTYETMFYAITGTFIALMIIGMIFTLVVAFRHLGGRSGDREIVTAHAIYWYFMGAVYTALWLFIYVAK
ncbi:MAG: cytochrome c oxidase subunit 3 [Ilumatobacteraceae bacterium]